MSASQEFRVRHDSFRAMGTTIELIGVGVSESAFDSGFRLARDMSERWETIFSRFRPESELSRLNASSGAVTTVSDDLFWMIERSMEAYRRTRGAFDPTILPALVAHGYDRDIDLIRVKGPAEGPNRRGPAPGMGEIELDPDRGTVLLPPGLQIDLGGIAKGAFVDRVALALMSWPGGCVNAGGDLRVWGDPPDGEHWLTGIEDPADPNQDVAIAALLDGRAFAVATSAVNRRRWQHGDGFAHHLIDPQTGQPAAEHLRSCTVFASSVVDAEIGTKAIFIAAGREAEFDLIDAAAAVVVDCHGIVRTLKGMALDAITLFPVEPHRQSA